MTRWPIRLGLLLCIGPGLLPAKEALPVRWSDLSRLVTNRRAALVLPIGAEIEGRVLRVEPDGLRIRVSRTSDRRVVPKGVQLIPRQSISVIRITQYRIAGRLLCTAGALALASSIVATRDIDLYEGPAVVLIPAMAAAGAVGAGVGGYFIGKRIDKKVDYIRVIPGD